MITLAVDIGGTKISAA
ncbi:hypothetical protein, partial [Escherichia coli]